MDFIVSEMEEELHQIPTPQKLEKEQSSGTSLYRQQWETERNDLWKFMPATVMRQFPLNGNEGLYGFTVRGSGIINVRDDLDDKFKAEVVCHESIHTTDEYETRVLSRWIIDSMMPEEEKYKTKPREYRH